MKLEEKKRALYDLSEKIRRCVACTRWKKRMLGLAGEGNSEGKALVILENGPNASQDREGSYFTQDFKKLLDERLKKENLTLNDVFVTGLVKCYSDNDTNEEEKNTCSALWLKEQRNILKMKKEIILTQDIE